MATATNTYAQCKACRAGGTRREVAEPVDLGPDRGGVFDRCLLCGSLDVDVLSEAGLAHEKRELEQHG